MICLTVVTPLSFSLLASLLMSGSPSWRRARRSTELATRCPSATAWMTSGPETASPAAHSHGSEVRPSASMRMRPRFHSSASVSAGAEQRDVGGLADGLDDHLSRRAPSRRLSSYFGAKRPCSSKIALHFQVLQARDLSRLSARSPEARAHRRSRSPLPAASSISSLSARKWAKSSSAVTVMPTLPYFFFCRRAMERAMSMATLPPPMTAISRGTGTSSPAVIRRRRSMAASALSLPGTRVERPWCRPMESTTAS